MNKDLKETEEFTRTYQLSPGFRVELSNFSGPVDIECHDKDEAQVHIVRRATERAHLDQGKVTVEQAENALRVLGAEEGRIAHEVELKLPHQVALVVGNIRGPLHIGEVDGPLTVVNISGPCHIAGANGALTLKDIRGNVQVGQLNGGLDVSGVSGPVSAGIAGLGENGIRVKSIRGPVELFFENKIDADINVEEVRGPIDVQLEDATTHKQGMSSAHLVVGEGKSAILISTIFGPVRIRQRR